MEPIGRMGEPAEVANAVVWLCSNEASFISGNAIPIDGAWTALIAGVALVGFVSANATEDDPANHTKFGVKGLILAVIIGLVMQGRKKESIEKANYFAIGALALTNIIIAVLWK